MAKIQWLVAVTALLLLAGNSAVAQQGILDRVIALPQYSTLVKALTITNLVPALTTILSNSSITIFAPDNAAFKKIPTETLTYLTTDPKGKLVLADILKYHVVKGSYPRPVPPVKLVNLLGKYLYITQWYNFLYVNYVKIVKPKYIYVGQGVVHGIDSVLIPPQYVYLFSNYKPYSWWGGWGTYYWGGQPKGWGGSYWGTWF